MSTRRLGFFLPRTNYLKVMGPVIDHLVRERSSEYRAVVLLPRWGVSKPQLRVDVDMLTATWGACIDVCELPDVASLAGMINADTLDSLFSVQPALSDVDPEEMATLRAASIEHGVKWVALPDGFSQDALVASDIPSVLANWDLVCTVGARSIRYLERFLGDVAPEAARAVRGRVHAVGYPEFDGLSSMADAGAIRQKYGLPADKRIVLMATAPRMVPLSVNTWMARGLDARFRGDPGWSIRGLAARATAVRYPLVIEYRRYLAALRRFADENDAIVVAKTRAKHQDADYVRDSVDHLVSDQSFFPFTTLELLRTASLYFGFYSNTASEAVMSGVYALTALFIPPAVAQVYPKWTALAELMSWGQEGLWRVPGVSSILDGTTRAGATALDRFAHSNFDSYGVDEERRGAMVRDVFNYPCNSSALVIDALASCWN
jgi:hypothetical protein